MSLYVHALVGVGVAAVVNTVGDRVADVVESELSKQQMHGLAGNLVNFGVYTGIAAVSIFAGEKLLDVIPGDDPLEHLFFLMLISRSRMVYHAYRNASMIVEDLIPRSVMRLNVPVAKKPCCAGCAKTGGSCGGK